MNLPHKILSVVLVAPLLFFAATQTKASDFKLVVSPPSTSIDGQPGEIIQKTIKITNNGTESITISSLISDFIVQDDQGTPVKVTPQASGRYLASTWITLTGGELTIPPQATVATTVLIQIPSNALPGGHYAGVFFTPTVKGELSSTGAAITPEIGSLFSITVPGDINYDAQITSFTTNQNIFEFGPVDFAAVINNQSDTHITTSPILTVKDMLGREVWQTSLTSTNIFPFTSRSFAATWETVWGIGRYSAILEAPYGASYTASRMLYFWIIPWRLIAAILIVLLVLLATIILVRRHKKHVTDGRDTEIDELKRRLIELENH